MTRAAVLISAAPAVSVVASACGARPASQDRQEEGPTKPEAAVPDTARLVCTENGSRLTGPKTRPQPDGVHLVVENRLDSDPGFAVEGDDLGLGTTPRPASPSTCSPRRPARSAPAATRPTRTASRTSSP